MDTAVYAAILAAGSSSRMGRDKLSVRFGSRNPIELSIRAFCACSYSIDAFIIAASQSSFEAVRAMVSELPSSLNVSVITGGGSRGESAHKAVKEAKRLAASSGQAKAVIAIHDAARCLVDAATIDAAIQSAIYQGSGIASIPVRDTLRRENGDTVPREGLFAMQTPQCFELDRILSAYEKSALTGYGETDDCAVYARAGFVPHFTDGCITNQKLTYESDIPLFAAMEGRDMHIGFGEDTHRLVEGRPLIIGGVAVAFEKGLDGHSDADVLTHAVMDALLGAAALGDIGRHFPDTDARYKGICSIELLRTVHSLIEDAGFTPNNIDATIIAQRPKLMPYIDAMRAVIAKALDMPLESVSIKATTTEGMNAEGRGECISARAVCTLKLI